MSNPDEVKAPPVKTEEWHMNAKDVIQLTDNTFKNVIRSKEPILVMFYAPWCTHCKQMKPSYFKAAEHLKAGGYKCKLAMVDCTENPDIAEKYEIAGFPTIKLFQNGKVVSDYKGKRSMDDFVSFMKSVLLEKTEL